MNQLSLFQDKPLWIDLKTLYPIMERDLISKGQGGKFVGSRGKGSNGILFIGEAPGYEESLKGEAFVGPAGKKGRQMLQAINIDFDDAIITNVVKIRPTKIVDGKIKDRTPTWEEVKENLKWLDEEIKLICKEYTIKVIVPLGGTATKAIFKDKDIKITKVVGQEFMRVGILDKGEMLVFPLLHPAAILHNPTEENKLLQWEALKKLGKLLGIFDGE